MPGLVEIPQTVPELTDQHLEVKQSKSVEGTACQVKLAQIEEHAAKLPSIDDCLAHLQLLEAFVVLKSKVELHASQDGTGKTWNAFVDDASDRFLDWAWSLRDGANVPMPAMDVLMVWHAFMLNTIAYARFAAETNLPKTGIDWVAVKRMLLSSDPLVLQMEPSCPATTAGEAVAAAGHRPSPTISLSAAVHRQHSFADKMARLAWHRLPTGSSCRPSHSTTLSRAIDRYKRFFTLIAANLTSPTTGGVGSLLAVPTLDVDLAWHTHQLNPSTYAAFSRAVTGTDASKGRVVRHDDTVDEADLKTNFAATQAAWREAFGVLPPGSGEDTEYVVCPCWACELSRDGVPGAREVAHLALAGASADAAVEMSLAASPCDDCGFHPTIDCREHRRRQQKSPAAAADDDSKCSRCGKDPCTCQYSCNYACSTCSNCSNCGGCGGG